MENSTAMFCRTCRYQAQAHRAEAHWIHLEGNHLKTSKGCMTKLIERSQQFGAGILLPLVVQSPSESFLPFGFIWPLFAAVNLFNVIYLQAKVAAIVRENPQLERDSRVFLKWWLIFAVLPFLLLYLFQRLGGFDHAFYVFSNDYRNPYIVAGWAVFILVNLGILYAVLWGGGARMLIQFR
ncbi:MAG TPA: hypothetical protein V6C65_23030, partial [Allocoleopsis sp.]